MSAAQPESKESKQSQQETPDETVARAQETAANAETKDPTEVLETNPNSTEAQLKSAEQKRLEEEQIKSEQEKEEAESLQFTLQIIQFVIVTGFGILMILAIGAVIFYLLDWAASIFDFDLSQYTQWLILILSGINIIMSCCGCYGTYKLSEVSKENDRRLKKVGKDIQDVGKGLEQDNKALSESLRRFQVEIDHLNNENNESIESLNRIKKQEKAFLEERGSEAHLFVGLKELWNLWKTYQTYRTIARITAITAEYYNKAFQDGDTENGLTKQQYEQLIRSPVVPRKERKFFPPFDHKVWRKEGRLGMVENGPILVDEFERVLVLIYKNILREELKVELSEEDKRRQQMNLGFTNQILKDEQRQKQTQKAGFFNRFFGD